MQEDFPARKAQYDIELGELDQQINALNNLLGRSVVCVSGDGVSQVSRQIGVVGVQVSAGCWGDSAVVLPRRDEHSLLTQSAVAGCDMGCTK